MKGSCAKKILDLALNQSPVYGCYRHLSEEKILNRIDWLISNGYLAIQYDYRLPLLVCIPAGWEIEKETYAEELFNGFKAMLADDNRPFNMNYLKDRNRELIWLLLEKIAATGNRKYIPLLEAWQAIDCQKVKQRIRQVINQLNVDGRQL